MVRTKNPRKHPPFYCKMDKKTPRLRYHKTPPLLPKNPTGGVLAQFGGLYSGFFLVHLGGFVGKLGGVGSWGFLVHSGWFFGTFGGGGGSVHFGGGGGSVQFWGFYGTIRGF